MTYSSDRLPPLESLVAVLEANRRGSFSSAAEALGVTHAAVSRRVHAAEHWLGTPLFERHGRGVRATPAGQRFVADVEQALSGIRESADRWRPRVELATVRISVVPSFARLWLLPRLSQLQGRPARVRIELALEHRVAEVGPGGVDLAIRYGRGRWPGVESRLLFRERLFPVASPELARELGSHPSVARIAQLPLLHDSNASHWRAWLAQGDVRFRAKAADRRFEDYDLVLTAAKAGLGIALLRWPLAADALLSGALVRIPGAEMSNTADHYLVTPKGALPAPTMLVVEELIGMTRAGA